jgi:Ca-activated chloride channel family protein
MKRDLERWRDKLTPEEERRVWSKMRAALHKRSSRQRLWLLRPWVTSTAAVAAALAIAIWQAQDHGLDLARTSPPQAMEKLNAPRGAPAASLMEARDSGVRDSTRETEEEAAGQAPQLLAGMPQRGSPPAAPEAAEEEISPQIDSERAEAYEPGEAQPKDYAAGRALGDVAEEVAGKASKQEVSGPVAATKSSKAGAQSFVAATESSVAATEGSAGAASGPDVTGKEPSVIRGEDLRDKGRVEEAAPAGALTMEARAPAKKARAGDAGEIRGRITDAGGKPVAYAQIVVVGTRYGAMTDEKGFFVIRNMPAGTYSLRAAAIGYEELVVHDVVVEKGKTKESLALRLKEEPREETKDGAGAGQGYMLGKLYNQGKKRADAQRQMPPAELETGEVRDMYSRDYPSLTGGSRPVNDDLADDMFFQHYGTNPFIDAGEDALSTFGLDVDTGSYTICRRYLREGHLPPTAAVRVEEFVNFFRKDYPPPRRGELGIQVDGMPSPFAHLRDGSYRLLRIGIRGRVIDDCDRMPAQVVLVIDTSGSMGMGNRLDLLKASMEVLLDEMRPDDEIGVVAFSTEARVVLPLTPLSEGRRVYRAIRSLHAEGSTNAEHGLKLGYGMLRKAAREGRIHRIILCSDGVANEGNTGWEEILDNVRRESDRISLTTIGFGMGNYNDVLLEQLADAGDGQYAYVDDLSEATRVLRENFTGTMQTIARNAKAQIEFDPRYVDKYRLLGYENRDVRDQDFRKDDVDAGEIGAGYEVTVLYEVKVKPEASRRSRLATVHLRYERRDGEGVVELDEPVRGGDFWREVDDAPADLVIDACVAEFAEILRGSYWAKDGSLVDVLDLLEETAEEMTSQTDVDELIDLVEEAIELQK